MHYVSLGSSFASGPGIPPIVNRRALRSGNNYPSHLAALLSVERHIDATKAGATLADIVSPPSLLFTPQIDSVDKDTDLVTITAGGNDLGYITAMVKDSMRKSRFGSLLISKSSSSSNALSEEELIKRFHSVFDAIRCRAPKAKIIVVGYPVVLGRHSTPDGTGFTEEELARHKVKGEALERISTEACKDQSNVSYLSIWDESADHAFGSDEAWVSGAESILNGMRGGPVAWHPTPKGMKEIGKMVYLYINSPNDIDQTAKGHPVSFKSHRSKL